jgi:serine/threonine protein kinase
MCIIIYILFFFFFIHIISADKYEELLWKGGVTEVYLCKRITDNKLVTLKISRDKTQHLDLTVCKKVTSKFVVSVLEYFEDFDMKFLVMEYCDRGNLNQLLKKDVALPTKVCV